MSKYDDLVKKLKEIFQIDRPELDFGVYRILGSRSQEINQYLEVDLKKNIGILLKGSSEDSLSQLKRELAEKEAQYHKDGFANDAIDKIPKIQELREKILSAGDGKIDNEDVVYSRLLTFFSRYYEDGDFVSKRRYKGDTYAIPYAGEEVVLHWANKDQFYTKSGENFSNYSFKLRDGRTIIFRLIEADTAKDNRKDGEVDRRFCLAEERVILRFDEQGEEYEDLLIPVDEIIEDGAQKLLIRFEYKAFPKGTKQEDLISKAVDLIFSLPNVSKNWAELSDREPTEKNPKRTLLEKCLTAYAAKNTSDYFIHKNLKLFLSRELDFYLKNEVLNLEDLQNINVSGNLDRTIRIMQAVRLVALDLISFLSQLEDFQRKLWLKKKFVVSSNYCMTLDRVPESLYSQVASNRKQWEQWRSYGMLGQEGGAGLFSNTAENTVDFLKNNQSLMVDTALFEFKFKEELLSKLDDLDESIDGLLVNGDNFQGLNLLGAKYQNKIDCIYIDPPYNAKSSEILYKNTFKHSSFLSFLLNRIEASENFLTERGLVNVAIDDYEHKGTMMLMDEVFGPENFIANVVVQHNPRGRNDDKFYGTSHEYMIVYAKDKIRANLGTFDLSDDDKALYKSNDGLSNFHEVSFMRTGNNSDRHTRPNLFYPIYVDPQNISFSLEPTEGYVEVLPVNPSGEEKTWRWERKTFLARCATEISVKVKDGEVKLYKKRRLEGAGKKPKTIWFDSKYDASSNGIMYLRNILGKDNEFSYPKSINTVLDTLQISTGEESVVLDYFAGSGTSGEAVLRLNRQDGGRRKYVLIEQGAYFDSVIKPRIQKIVFSPEWKAGLPIKAADGISHCFKVLKIESYEDTLNNIKLVKALEQSDLLTKVPDTVRDEYLLDYMLDIESRGSLLSVSDFKRPFEYRLKISVNSAGAYENQNIDLIETFNYLLGLDVKHVDTNRDEGFVFVQGTLLNGEKTLIIWRDEALLSYEQLNKLCDRLAINPSDSEFDVVYINGDHNIPAAFTSLEKDGGITKTLKIKQIEPEFLSLMFRSEAH
jgi:adenine-specific DNA-methyltransferase